MIRAIAEAEMSDQPAREVDIGEALTAALSDYMLIAYGRRPNREEIEEIYWLAVEAIRRAAE